MKDIVEQLRHPNMLIGPVVLLLLAEKSGHGYQLTERLKSFGFDETRPSSLYRELRRLEDEGLVSSHWDPSARGAARRVYELTAEGRRSLRACAEGADNLTQMLAEYIDRCRHVPSPSRARHRRLSLQPIRT